MREIETLQIQLEKYKAILEIVSANLCWDRHDENLLEDVYDLRSRVLNPLPMIVLDKDHQFGRFDSKSDDRIGVFIVNTANDQAVTDRDEQCILFIKYFRGEIVRVSEEIAKLAVLSGFRFTEYDLRLTNQERLDIFDRYCDGGRRGRR